MAKGKVKKPRVSLTPPPVRRTAMSAAHGNAEKNIGAGQLRTAKHGKDQFGLKMKNADRLQLAKAGTKNVLDGTMKANQKRRAKNK